MSESSILIVEDDPNSARFIEHLLRKAELSLHISIAQDGLAASTLLFPNEQLTQSLPSLIILDLMLPYLSGNDILKRLKADSHTKSIPIIVLTALTEERQMVSTYSWGASSFLRKPFDPQELVAAVRSLLSQ